MVVFAATIKRFQKMGEKTGWSYIEISRRHAEKLNPGKRVSYRVKGLLDQHQIEKTAILPMGKGNFIMPINGKMRKAIGKQAGDKLKISLELDHRPQTISTDFLRCLKDDPPAHSFFRTLPKSHQIYFSKWIEGAKTAATKAKRITMAVVALASRQGFSEMLRANKNFR